MGRFFEELRRRNVFRVAVAYVVASWLVLQVADIVLQGIEAPSWVMKVFMLILALGCPLALLFSWAYELTPEGLKKEKDVDRANSITPDTGRKLDIITIGMLVAVLAVFAVDRSLLHDHVDDDDAKSGAAAVGDKSIAVLAFEDLSPDGDQAYFAEGLSEELLNVLAKRGDLQVAGRTSSFAFKGQQKDLREIGELLNVAHILEGSVRKSGNRIRVTAQLIKADDGFHLFSETYDRELSDVFAVQDEIASEISNALLTEIVGTEAVVSTTDPEAYELFLMARQRIHSRDILNLREASTMLDRALEIDAEYAPALAQKGLVTYLMSDSLGAYGDAPVMEVMPIATELVQRALAVDDDLAEAHAVNGLLLDNQGRTEEAIVELRRALELNPTMSDAGNWLSSAFSAQGDPMAGRRVLEEVVKRDPTYGPAYNNLVMDYVRSSEFDAAHALTTRVEQIVGDNDDVRMSKGIIAVMNGDNATAIRQLRYSLDLNPSSTVLKFWHGFALIGLADFETLHNTGLPAHRILALGAMGSKEDMLDELERFEPRSAFVPRALGEIGIALISLGESERFIEYVEKTWGSAQSLVEQEPTEEAWGTGYLAPLAWAYRARGDARTTDWLIDELRRDLDSDAEQMNDNWLHAIGQARYAVLTDNPEAALAAMNRAVDMGLRALVEIDSPIYDDVRSVHGFAEFDARLRGLVDDDRGKLGMPAYRPVPVTQERQAPM